MDLPKKHHPRSSVLASDNAVVEDQPDVLICHILAGSFPPSIDVSLGRYEGFCPSGYITEDNCDLVQCP